MLNGESMSLKDIATSKGQVNFKKHQRVAWSRKTRRLSKKDGKKLLALHRQETEDFCNQIGKGR
jgi:hypothetical protein